MALVLADRVQETTNTTGTGTLTLAGAVSGFQSFTAIGNANTTYYTIVSGTLWETGVGTYTLIGTTLSRDTVLSSSAAGAKISVTAGAFVFCSYPAGQAVYEDSAGVVTGYPISGGSINSTPIGATTPSTVVGTNISSATAPTNTVAALALTGTPNNAAGAKTGVLAVGPNFTATDKNIMASFVQNINDYTQIVVQNPNSGTAASADFIVNNDNTTGAGTYGDFGINSSGFTGTGSFNTPNNIYLYAQGGDLVIGTQSANIVKFPIGSSTAADAIQITSTGLNSAPIGATTASTGTFTTLSCTSVADTGSLARNAGKTANTSILNQATFTTGGLTLATQTAAVGSTWRIRAFGQFTSVSNGTARTAQVACFWGTTQLTAITPSVLVTNAQTTQWQCEFTLTASSTTAIWTAGTMIGRTASTTALAIDNATAASTAVTSGAQTLDLRFRVSTAVASEGWTVQSVIMERLE